MATPDPTSTGAPRARGADPDRIIVNGLVVDASIGVHDFEHEAPQRVRFDIAIDTVDDYADRVRTTGAYVSYADIVEYVMTRAASGEHVELVETWAEDVAAAAPMLRGHACARKGGRAARRGAHGPREYVAGDRDPASLLTTANRC